MCVHNKINKMGRTMLMVTAGVMAAGLLAAQLHAQSFVISQNGKSVGSASLSVKPGTSGVSSTSGVKIDMPGLKYSFSENASLDAGYRLGNVQMTGSVNGTAAKVGLAPQGQQFVMKIDANGKVTNTPLAFHPLSIFYPDFDPGALQVLLNLGAAHNNRDLWALIPKQAGSVGALHVATKMDEQGTLDGHAVAVHHLTVTGDATTTELFSGPSNELLQAEWTDEGFALVRQGFKLTPPKRPTGAPPAAPPADQQQQPQQDQPQQAQPQPQ
jgi:hypothetical protein